jgi:hypothetical protein
VIWHTFNEKTVRNINYKRHLLMRGRKGQGGGEEREREREREGGGAGRVVLGRGKRLNSVT